MGSLRAFNQGSISGSGYKVGNANISMEHYQKSMNLYLYIPPLLALAHPPSCFKGLICGKIRWYWLQNNPERFQEILLSFIQGSWIEATPLLTQVARTLDHKTLSPASHKSEKFITWYIHWQYHPDGLEWSEIRQIYEKILQPHLPFDKTRVAVSRPKNLRDSLTKTSLTPPQNVNIHKLIETLTQT